MNLKMNFKTNKITFAVSVVLVVVASTALSAAAPGASTTLTGYGAPSSHNQAKRPPACYVRPEPDPSQPPGPPPEMKPTTITTIRQAYYCILDNYYDGPVLNNRSLLVAAFAGLTLELQRRGLDQPQAMPPALTGKVDDDLAAFSQAYQQITANLPDDPAVRQAVAEATMRAMVDSLHVNHTGWGRSFTSNLSGIFLSGFVGPVSLDPAARSPLFVTEANDPAKSAGVQAGDEIVAINGVPPFINGELSAGAIKWITESKRDTPVELTLRRPATDATFNVTVTPGPSAPPDQDSDFRLVDGNIAYVRLRGFSAETADRALAAIAEMRKSARLRGVIIDLRGNGGGSGPDRLLGALAHDKVIGYLCDAKGYCTKQRTDDSVQLLNLPVVTLIDRGCASACDVFASAVKDLRLGALVGTRTAGEVAGPADSYQLEDGSSLTLPKFYQIGPNREIINTIGVAPDYFAAVTAADLSAGRDPGLAKAVELLNSHRP
jgi:carboxyl-terminal processing protease